MANPVPIHTTSRRLATAATALIYVFLIAGALLSLFPFLWMLLTSLKSFGEVGARVFWPTPPQWHNYVEAWNAAPFGRYFANTLLIAGATIALDLVTGVLAAYAFARMVFPLRNVIFFVFLSTLMIPSEVTTLPNFLIVRNINRFFGFHPPELPYVGTYLLGTYESGWYDTYLAQIVPFGASVFHIFLLRQFFLSIPRELHDAALIDGCGHFRFLTQIVVPLSKAALVTVALLSFIGSWNAFLWPLIATSSVEVRPIQVGLRSFVTEEATQTQLLMAAAAIVIAPILIFYFFTQKQFTEGIATTGLKG